MTTGLGLKGQTALDAVGAWIEDCSVDATPLRAQGSCDGDVHVRPTLLADRAAFLASIRCFGAPTASKPCSCCSRSVRCLSQYLSPV